VETDPFLYARALARSDAIDRFDEVAVGQLKVVSPG
jgi:hypothetical protein